MKVLFNMKWIILILLNKLMILISILLLLRKEMGEYRPSKVYIGALFVSYALLIVVTIKNISDFITKYL